MHPSTDTHAHNTPQHLPVIAAVGQTTWLKHNRLEVHQAHSRATALHDTNIVTRPTVAEHDI